MIDFFKKMGEGSSPNFTSIIKQIYTICLTSILREINKKPLENHRKNQNIINSLTLSRRRPLSYRNQYIDLLRKSMDWFLYDNGLRLERVK